VINPILSGTSASHVEAVLESYRQSGDQWGTSPGKCETKQPARETLTSVAFGIVLILLKYLVL
jgi:hypothetical protein